MVSILPPSPSPVPTPTAKHQQLSGKTSPPPVQLIPLAKYQSMRARIRVASSLHVLLPPRPCRVSAPAAKVRLHKPVISIYFLHRRHDHVNRHLTRQSDIAWTRVELEAALWLPRVCQVSADGSHTPYYGERRLRVHGLIKPIT